VLKKLGETGQILAALGGSLRTRASLRASARGKNPVQQAIVTVLRKEPRSCREVVAALVQQGTRPFEAAEALVALVRSGQVIVDKAAQRTKEQALAEAERIAPFLNVFVNKLLVRNHLAAIYEQAAENDKAAEQHHAIAEELLARGLTNEALEVLRKVLKLKPRDIAARELVVKVLHSAKRVSEAAKEAIELGQLLLECGLPGRAAQAFELALRLVPEGMGLRWMLAGLYERLGRKTEAVKQYEEIAGISEKAGDNASALAAYQKVLELEPNHERARSILYGLSGHKRALVVRALAAGAAVLICLATLGWGAYEMWAVSQFERVKAAVFDRLGQQDFEGARSAVHRFADEYTGSRFARNATEPLLKVIGREEDAVLERHRNQARRSAVQNRIEEALKQWKALRSAVLASRGGRAQDMRAEAQKGVEDCDEKLHNAALKQALAEGHLSRGFPEKAYESLKDGVDESPWLLESPTLTIPCQVDSIPSGARVTGDGVPLGAKTPKLTVKRPVGGGTLTFRLPGYVDVNHTFEPIAHKDAFPPYALSPVVLPIKPLWSLPDVIPTSAPVVARDLILVTALDRTVVAVNQENGSVAWRFALGVLGPCDLPPAVLEPEGLVAIRTNDGALLALDLEKGTERWRSSDLEPPRQLEVDRATARPVAVKGGFLVRTGEDGVAFLSARDGRKLHEASGLRGLVGVPASYGTDRVLVAHSSSLTTLRLPDLARIGVSNLRGRAVTAPVVLGSIFLAIETFERNESRQFVARLYYDRDAREWAFQYLALQGAVCTPLESSVEWVVLATRTPNKVVRVTSGGRPTELVAPGGELRWVAVNGRDRVLAGDGEALYGFDEQRERWRHPTKDGTPATSPDGKVVYQGALAGLAAYPVPE
jgi:tetratricopeptide (TPR) repeat protein